MSTFMIVYWVFFGFWFFGGVAFFTYLKHETLKRKARETVKKTQQNIMKAKQNVKDAKKWFKGNAAGFGLLAPFLIPIIVTLLCLIFG